MKNEENSSHQTKNQHKDDRVAITKTISSDTYLHM